MNPWSGAETSGESLERELFARRARAVESGAVPSLAAVMRAAAEKREERAAESARGRAFMAMALAAACLMAALTKIPREVRPGARASIAADVDASAGARSFLASAEEPPAGATCSVEDERVVAAEQACFTPAPLYTPAPEPVREPSTTPCTGEAHAPPTCDPNESCAISQ